MDKELVSALQCGLRMLDGTAGGYTPNQKFFANSVLVRHGINPNSVEDMQELLTAELAKPE